MDTHIPTLSADDPLAKVSHAGLAAEASQRQAPLPEPPTETAVERAVLVKPRRRRRKFLYATVSVLGLAAVTGAFLFSPYNHVLPINTARLEDQARHLAGMAGLMDAPPTTPIVAPAAKLASSAPRPDATPLYRQPPKPREPGTEADEVLGFYAGPGGARASSAQPDAPTARNETGGPANSPAPRAATARPLASPGTVGEVGMDQPAPAPAETRAEVAAPPPAPPVARIDLAAATTPAAAIMQEPSAPEAASPTVVATAQPGERQAIVAAPASSEARTDAVATTTTSVSDPVQTVINLRAAPTAQEQQEQVLGMVAKLAIIVRDLKQENAGLKATTKANTDKLDAALADFRRRLVMVEAATAVNAAGVDPSNAPAPHSPATPAAAVQSPPTPTPAAPPASGGSRRYRVQAASPGLAMLSDLDRGDGASLTVLVGDTVPGHGKVISIQQQGANWVVSTDRGPIQ